MVKFSRTSFCIQNCFSIFFTCKCFCVICFESSVSFLFVFSFIFLFVNVFFCFHCFLFGLFCHSFNFVNFYFSFCVFSLSVFH